MTQDVTIPIDFGQGIDTKTDPKLVMASKFQLLKDGVFTKAKQVAKRNGYDNFTLNEVGGGAISNPKMVKDYVNELICAATGSNGPRLFSYSQALAGWVDKGKYSSVNVASSTINSQTFSVSSSSFPNSSYGVSNTSAVVSGNIALYGFDTTGNSPGFKSGIVSNTLKTFITVVDLSTGTHLVDTLQITNSLGFSKVAVLGASTFAIFYISSSSSNRLAVRIITVSLAGSVSVGSEVTIGPCQALASTSSQFPYCYDYVTTSTGACVAVSNQPNINLFNIDTTGATTATATVSSTGAISPLSLTLDASNNVWIFWGSASINLYYAIQSSSLSVVLAPTLLIAVPTINGIQPNLQQVTSIISSSTVQSVYYSTYYNPGGTQSAILPIVSVLTATLAGSVTSPSLFRNNCDIYGKPFTISSRNYLPCVSISISNSTGFILDLNDSLPVAKFMQDRAEGLIASGYGLNGTTSPAAPVTVAIRYPGFINVPQILTSTKAFLGAGYVVSASIFTISAPSAVNLSVCPLARTLAANTGSVGITLDFNHADANQALVQQDILVLNGGIVSSYDSDYISELGFSIDPDNISATASASGGSMSAGTYIYYVTYEWVDALGNLYESAPSIGTWVLFTTGSSNSVTLTIPTLEMTQKNNVYIKVWRSDSNEGGNIAYLVATVANAPTVASGPYVTIPAGNGLSVSSSGPIFNPTLYTQAGAILENIAPPPSMILWTNNNRVWAIDSENPETTTQYSKTASKGTGIAFSTGQLEVIVDSKNGVITGASPMDEKTVLLKESGLGIFIGDGANDSGTGSTIQNFQFIPSDVGCTNSKSVILYPGGILFRTTKGIYELSRGLQTSYFGMAVEAYNGQDIRAADIVPTKNQIRFLTSSGLSILYDYVMGQWSLFTNHTGYSSCNWQGIYVYVRTDGKIYSENTTSFLDDTASYAPALQTSWMNLASVQAFQRVKELLPLGDYQNGNSSGHGIQVQAAYDFSPTFGTSVPYYFGAANTSGVFQYRHFFSQQKCDTISLLITEITTGASGEYIDLTNMSFWAGLKKGTNKLSPARSVG